MQAAAPERGLRESGVSLPARDIVAAPAFHQGAQLPNESLSTCSPPGDLLGLELRTASQAVIRISHSFLGDVSFFVGPTSTAWLWDRLGCGTCSGTRPFSGLTLFSKEALYTDPWGHTTIDRHPTVASRARQPFPLRTKFQGTAGSSELPGHVGRVGRSHPVHASCSGCPPPHVQSASPGKCSVELPEKIPDSLQEMMGLFGRDGTGFLSGC